MASPELEMVIQMLRARPRDGAPNVAEMRAGLESMVGLAPIAADLRRETVAIGGVPGESLLAEGADPGRTVLYLHGGGYVIGSINTHRDLAGRISREARARTVLIDYRLAPEHPHPAAVEDAVAAYRGLVDGGADPRRTVIAGDSAGGGLTVATLVALRDAGDPLPAGGVCLSPWVDLEGLGESMEARADRDPMVSREGLLWMAAMYLGDNHPRTPLAAPLHADLAGLPPLYIQVGHAETLYDDAVRLADAARAAGVDVTLEAWDDMIHVWQAFAAILPEARAAVEKIGAFVRDRT